MVDKKAYEMVKEWPEMVKKEVSDETVTKWSRNGRRNGQEFGLKSSGNGKKWSEIAVKW